MIKDLSKKQLCDAQKAIETYTIESALLT